MRRLIESGAVDGRNFVQVGLRGYWPPVETFEWMQAHGLRYHFMTEIEERGAEAVDRRRDRRGARRPRRDLPERRHRRRRPGPRARAPARPSRAACSPASCCGRSAGSSARSSSPGMDIVEVSPPYDQAETTAMIANRAALEAISALAVKRRGRRHGPLGAPWLSATGSRAITAEARARSPASTTSTSSRTRATSTSTSPSPSADRRPDPRARRRDRPARGPARGGRPRRHRGRPRPGDARAGRRRRVADEAGRRRPGSSSSRRDLLDLRLPDAGSYRLAFIALNSLFLLATRDAPARRRSGRHRRPPRAGRPRRRRRLAARRRRPRPVRRPADPRVRPDRSRDGPPGDEGRRGPPRRRDRRRRPDDDLRGGPRRARPAARWIRHDALRLVGAGRAARASRRTPGSRSRCWPASYDLEPLGPGSDRAILVARRA